MAKKKEQSKRCPHCGSCLECGSPPHRPYVPYVPYVPYIPYRERHPFWWSTSDTNLPDFNISWESVKTVS